MKTVIVSHRSKTVQTLLKQARHKGLILEMPSGERFMLAPIPAGDWVGFDVGESEDFSEEANATARNKELARFLSSRNRKHKPGSGIPIKEVRRKLGLKKTS
ncbi:MAG: hypothetical protein HND47_02670 [Chloroflexi bacterium]|nr:hypothetical protein [Chloroflexota bacterium]